MAAIIYNVPVNGSFYGKLFEVVVHEFRTVVVDSPDYSSALDDAVDYCEEQGWTGCFLDANEVEEIEAEGYLDDYVMGGNHCLVLSYMGAGYTKRINPRVKR